MPKHQVHLTDEQRQRLVDITSKGKTAVRTFKRSQILLLGEQGYKDSIIAERVGVSIATVSRQLLWLIQCINFLLLFDAKLNFKSME